MSAIRTPNERSCTRCGRHEEWNEEEGTWTVVDEEVGDVYCIHAWDITGQFTPVEQ
ncbi:HEWD family protein [Halospeciosus flavus]|uniref:HEWD family protein n=1 Tax=Halospeciosus flavus TaxID=3032283 RepID=A0ABD5Z2U1_9EURY|nr:HEWD family protein [Halospeciosus flavus]